MENIVYNFARITFQPKEVVLTENRSLASFQSTTNGTSSNNFSWNLKSSTVSSLCASFGAASSNMAEEMQENTTDSNSDEEQVDGEQSPEDDNDDDSDFQSSVSSFGRRSGVCRRRNPARASKDHFNRVCSVIMKPSKKKRKELSTNALTLKSIEKIYTNKRLKKFTPTNLETIFEEPSDENAADVEDDSEECAISNQVRLVKFGGRKLRRAITFNDGLNKNKNLIKKRRQKVKKTFGKRYASKKITMTEFHDRLNKSWDSAMHEVDEDSSRAIETSKIAAFTMDDLQLPALASTVGVPSVEFE